MWCWATRWSLSSPSSAKVSLDGLGAGCPACSFERGELGTSGGTDSNLTVTDRLVSHGVLSKVASDHVGLDLDGVPVLAGVNLANGTDHLGHDDAVTEVGLDSLGLLTVRSVFHGEDELLNESVVAGVDTVSEAPSLAG